MIDSAAGPDLPPNEVADTVVGPIRLPAGNQYLTNWIREYGTWELAESAALTALIRAGAYVIDVGAHVGYLTLLAAARTGSAGRVLAIEANPSNFALLQANLAQASTNHVDAVHAAAWRRSGEALTMTVSHDNSGDHRMFLRDNAAETVKVRSVAIDDLVPGRRRVDVVKVDVQGTDHVAIEGMQNLIRRWQPIILVEFWPPGIEEFGGRPSEVLAFYRSLGYDLVMLEKPGLAQNIPLTTLVEQARECPGEFCTLILQPSSTSTLWHRGLVALSSIRNRRLFEMS